MAPEPDPLDFYGVPEDEQLEEDDTEPNPDADNYTPEA